MTLQKFIDLMLPEIESELKRCVYMMNEPTIQPFLEMLTYHMGWTGEGAGAETTGKRIRPMLLLLSCGACGGNWESALSAAASIELIHNFSLAHDDIQDSSMLRRGRPTVWKNWGIAQAINVGDVLFMLAHLAISRNKTFPSKIAQQISKIIDEACISLSIGQFLDINYEKQGNVSIHDYWKMVSGKTAALLSACTHIGAILGGADDETQKEYVKFGHFLGLAFQVHDDYLGIWGDSALTGKSNESDLVTGKKTFPVLYGLSKNGPFATRWQKGPISMEEASLLSEIMAKEGIKSATLDASDKMTTLAQQSLFHAKPQGEAGQALIELASTLIGRQA